MNKTIFDVDAIASSGSAVMTFADAAAIHERGDEGQCAYIVKRGRVELRQKGRPVETIGPGELFGEASLITGAPRLNAAVAVGNVELLPIGPELFHVLVRDDEDFAQAIIQLLARRLRATTEMFERCVEELPVAGAVAGSPAASARATA